MYLSRRFGYLTLLMTSCFAAITIKTSDPYKSEPIVSVVELLESCYGKRITPVGLAGRSTGLISKILWTRGGSVITLIDSTSRIMDNYPSRWQIQYKLQVIVVTASSSIDLTTTLGKIKSSIWWNHMATFLILEWPSLDHGCLNPFEMLWTAWEMDILNAKLICRNREKGRLIYTYNPYTTLAPVTWQIAKIYSGKNGHPWTLFARCHENHKGICSELDFEKTNDLGGYKIRVSVTDRDDETGRNNSYKVCGSDWEHVTCEIVFPALNAIPDVQVHSFESLGYVDEQGNPHDILKEVMSGQSDVAVFSRYITSLPNVSISYPHWHSGLHIITQYRGYKSQLSKIVSVIDIDSRYLVCMVCLINILFFRYFLHQPVMIAFLNSFRIICNTSLLNIPKKVAPRLYLGSLFLSVVTLEGIFMGRLASLLTKQESLRNVNTEKDLIALNYTITYGVHFRDPEFRGRFNGLQKLTCTEYVLRNPRVACVSDIDFLSYDAAKFKLHLSTKSLVNTYMALPIRPDWPLEKRVNTILRRSVETGWSGALFEGITRKTYLTLQIRENDLLNQSFSVLTSEQLGFAFATLGIGLGCATISFIIEVVIRRSCSERTTGYTDDRDRQLHFNE